MCCSHVSRGSCATPGLGFIGSSEQVRSEKGWPSKVSGQPVQDFAGALPLASPSQLVPEPRERVTPAVCDPPWVSDGE